VKAVVQRVTSATVRVEGRSVGRIGQGMLVMLGVVRGDRPEDARALAERIALARFFADDEGRMNRSVAEVGGAILVVSQFTLAADLTRGRRPSFERAAPPEEARGLYQAFVDHLRAARIPTETGVFGARMQVELINDGPVTLWFESHPRPEGPPEGATQVLA
jgi:D-tyrosyl-tRNA(Tyr) deacylase